jgi:hypothetical protein
VAEQLLHGHERDAAHDEVARERVSEPMRRELLRELRPRCCSPDLGALGGVARRGVRHLREGLLARLLLPEREEVGRALAQARADVEQLVTTFEKEARSARPDDAGGDPAAAP